MRTRTLPFAGEAWTHPGFNHLSFVLEVTTFFPIKRNNFARAAGGAAAVVWAAIEEAIRGRGLAPGDGGAG